MPFPFVVGTNKSCDQNFDLECSGKQEECNPKQSSDKLSSAGDNINQVWVGPKHAALGGF